ncbi:MAG TPA: hypothetical protein EYO50_07065 [Candidatus Marinimicrobia bacterium]|jgi:hypothetical protein|nr:hypothetical protein [Candidatus Neomarinimicrobiota bacterium]|tara:strand:- start:2196 stop:2777 length:582 start_codon:yes stop_codon:yes gene_type:complete
MKNTLIITLIIFGNLMITSCGSSSPPVRSGSTEAPAKQDYSTSGFPDFFLNPPTSEDAFYGVGTAKKQNPSLAKKTATARARDEIAQAVEVKVNNMLRDFIQESGVGENAQALEFTESVSKQVSSQALTGSKIIKTEVAKDGTFYVLVEYALQNAVDASVSEARNQEALYNEFKARQGFEALEKELNSLNTGP